MQTDRVVRFQKINKVKFQKAKELRRSMTLAEKILWEHVRNGKILGIKIRRQQIIDGFIVDFFCGKARLVIEVDGSVHENEGHKSYDKERKKIMEVHGLSEIRFTNDEVMNNIDSVIHAIESAVSRRTACVARDNVNDPLLLKEKGRG
jgi:very-short-patch-repair endonuclease